MTDDSRSSDIDRSLPQIPDRWEWARFADVARVTSNLVDPALYPDLPHIAPNHIESWTGRLLPYATVAKDGVTSPKHLFEPGQVLYSKIRPYLVKTVLAPFQGLCSADMYPIATDMDTSFLAHWLRTPAFTAQATAHQGRSVLPKINQEALNRLMVPVPPLGEQRRIAEVIDAAFSNLEAGVSYLLAGRTRLERLRDAVVAESLRATPFDRVALGDLAWDADYGTSVRCTYEDEGVPVLRIPNIQGGQIDMTDLKRAPADTPIKEDSIVRSGDLLIVRTNGSRNLIGRAAAASEDLDMTFASYLIRYRLRLDRALPQFVSAIFGSRPIRRDLESRAASTAGQYNLSLRTLRDIEVPLPSLPEQGRIVAELDEVGTSIRALELQLDAASRRSESLRRSVLFAAFSGELVPQDPADEPAELFLKHLTSDRPATIRRTRRPRVDARGIAR